MFNRKETAYAAAFGLLTHVFAITCVGQASSSRKNGPEGPPFAYSSSGSEGLPDAPSVQPNGESAKGSSLGDRILNAVDPGYGGVASKWDVTINKGEKVQPFTPADKIHYAWTEEFTPVSLFTAAYSGGYEQLRDTDPHYGSDSAAFGERTGAAAFRQGVYRMFGDGFFPALTHEDPRYYRVRDGSIVHRSLGSLEQVVVRHRDNGTIGLSYSGLAGHALAEGLPLTFYPRRSTQAWVGISGFLTALGADGVTKLSREFLPDLFQAMRLTRKQ